MSSTGSLLSRPVNCRLTSLSDRIPLSPGTHNLDRFPLVRWWTLDFDRIPLVTWWALDLDRFPLSPGTLDLDWFPLRTWTYDLDRFPLRTWTLDQVAASARLGELRGVDDGLNGCRAQVTVVAHLQQPNLLLLQTDGALLQTDGVKALDEETDDDNDEERQVVSPEELVVSLDIRSDVEGADRSREGSGDRGRGGSGRDRDRSKDLDRANEARLRVPRAWRILRAGTFWSGVPVHPLVEPGLQAIVRPLPYL
jgi:hypothetical protein